MPKGHYAFELKLQRSKILLYMSETLYAKKHEWNTERHSNANYELHIILQGKSNVEVETKHCTVQRKQAILIAPGQYHRPKTTPGDFEMFSLSFSLSEGSLLTALQTIAPSSIVFSITEDIEALCHSIFYEIAAGNSFRREMIQAQLMQLLLLNFRLLRLSEEVKVSAQPMDRVTRTELIDSFFQNHFADNAAEVLLAKELHLSPRQLSRVIQKYYNMSFREKLMNARLDHAAWLLRTTDKWVCEIANSVGYSSEAGFYQVFRRHFNMTPQEYRLKFKASQENTPAK